MLIERISWPTKIEFGMNLESLGHFAQSFFRSPGPHKSQMNVNARGSGYTRRFNGIGKVLSSTDGPCI